MKKSKDQKDLPQSQESQLKENVTKSFEKYAKAEEFDKLAEIAITLHRSSNFGIFVECLYNLDKDTRKKFIEYVVKTNNRTIKHYIEHERTDGGDALIELRNELLNVRKADTVMNNRDFKFIEELLIDGKFDVNKVVESGDSKGLSLIHFLAREKDGFESMNILKIGEWIRRYLLDIDSVTETDDEYNGMTALHIAVINKNNKMVEYLLQNGADPNKAVRDFGSDDGFNGMTSLHIASKLNNHDIIKYLLSNHKVDPNQGVMDIGSDLDNVAKKTNNLVGYKAIHLAVDCGDDDALNIFLNSERVDVDATFAWMDKLITPLTVAFLKKLPKKVNLILQSDKSNVNGVESGDSPIILAYFLQYDDIITILLNHKEIKIDKVDFGDFSPISDAITHQKHDRLQKLLDAGANIHKVFSTKSNDGETIVYLNPFEYAVNRRDAKSINILLKKDKSKIDDFGCFPGFNILHFSVAQNNLEILNILIQNGADVNKLIEDSECRELIGLSPIQVATLRGHHEVIKILSEAGADVNKLTEGGKYHDMSAIHIAAIEGDDKVIVALLEAGAEIDRVTHNPYYNGKNALEIAFQEGKVDAVKALVESGKFNILETYRDMQNESQLEELQRNCGYLDLKKNNYIPRIRKSLYNSFAESSGPIGNQAGKILEIFAFSGLAMSASVVPSAEVYSDFTRKFNLEKEGGASIISEFCSHDSKSNAEEIVELPSKKRRIESPERIKTVFLELSHENATTKPSTFLSPRLTEKSSEEKDKSKGRGVG